MEYRAERGDEFGHPGHGFVELGTESLFDLRADLGSQAENEPARAQQLMVVGLMGEMNRIARERDSHVGHQIQAGHRCRQRQRREDVVRALEGGDAACARITELPSALSRVGQSV